MHIASSCPDNVGIVMLFDWVVLELVVGEYEIVFFEFEFVEVWNFEDWNDCVFLFFWVFDKEICWSLWDIVTECGNEWENEGVAEIECMFIKVVVWILPIWADDVAELSLEWEVDRGKDEVFEDDEEWE